MCVAAADAMVYNKAKECNNKIDHHIKSKTKPKNKRTTKKFKTYI